MTTHNKTNSLESEEKVTTVLELVVETSSKIMMQPTAILNCESDHERMKRIRKNEKSKSQISQESPRRSKSDKLFKPLLLREVKHKRSQSLDDDLPLSTLTEEDQTVPDTVVEATIFQRQLMRQVSALGLEDPVFGNSTHKMAPTHASHIFNDMDFDAVPPDMRHLVPSVSDHTDSIKISHDDNSSPLDDRKLYRKPSKGGSILGVAPPPRRKMREDVSLETRNTTNFDPPVGSFRRRVSTKPVAQIEIRSPSTQKLSMKVSTTEDQRSLDCSFVPPTGSFIRRRPRAKDASNQIPQFESSLSDLSQLHDNEDSSLHPSNQHAFIPPKGSFKSKRRPRKDFGDSLSSLHYDDDVERELVRHGVFSQKENGQVGYQRRLLPTKLEFSPLKSSLQSHTLPSMDLLYSPHKQGSSRVPQSLLTSLHSCTLSSNPASEDSYSISSFYSGEYKAQNRHERH